MELSPDSLIALGENEHEQVEAADFYADHMSRSRWKQRASAHAKIGRRKTIYQHRTAINSGSFFFSMKTIQTGVGCRYVLLA